MKMKRRSWSILFVAAILALTMLLIPGGGHLYANQGVDRANDAKERHIDALFAIEGVFGAGVTQTPGGEGAVVVYTKSARVKVPGELDGVPVIKRVTGEIVALDPTDKFDRPVPIGVSAGNESIVTGKGPPRCTVGTIGARVIDDQGTPDTADDILYNLSNNHVYAQEGTAPIGSGIT